MCAIEAAKKGHNVTILEHTGKIAEKIRISGGGRCNFTNLYTGPDRFISQNPHFCKSALARFTPHDIMDRIKKAHIPFHEKPYDEKIGNESARGQMFCDHSAQDLITLLTDQCAAHHVTFSLNTKVLQVSKNDHSFSLETCKGTMTCDALVVATGGLSIPKIGASGFGYDLARKFHLPVIETKAALVPLTFDPQLLAQTKALSGVSTDASVSCTGMQFREGLLLTHRGFSGPSILQISSYWDMGAPIHINLLPDLDMLAHLKQMKNKNGKQQLRTALSEFLPARLSALLCDLCGHDMRLGDMSDKKLQDVANIVNHWEITPNGTEGYKTAEVTRGGIDTNALSSKTFEAKSVPDLYFIGEVVDVTGHLGGHNFQWAWASGWCAGQAL